MARVTITLPGERYEQLKSQAASTHKSIDTLVEESLAETDAAQRQRVLEILEKARLHALSVAPELTEDEGMEIAVEETRTYRREKATHRDAVNHH
jgi:hypothetical protein